MYFIIREGEIHAGPFDSMTEARGVKGGGPGDKIVDAECGRIMFHISTNGKWEKLSSLRFVSLAMRNAMRLRVFELEKANALSRHNDAELRAAIDETRRQLIADMVNKPPHYNQAGIECIDAIAAATSGKTGIQAVCVANVIKYLWRYELKNGVEDAKKARWYLDRLIGEMEK